VAGCWLVQANQFGRATALVLLAVLGLTHIGEVIVRILPGSRPAKPNSRGA
jgi:hypothetical protein